MARLTDAEWMARALCVAERGRGGTGPNPLVGAVVVSPDGVVVGQGAHREAGGPHAEVAALDVAGADAVGATLYCTLEPCCHQGRTGPCVERIARAGVVRVVTATNDPNPKVNGAGHDWLRRHGIAVTTKVGEGAARRQNGPFLTWISQGRPWTVLKTATSAQGCVGRVGERVALSGPEMSRWMHRQRAWIDALMVGADTVIADDPLLTARGAYRDRPFTRVIVDWRGRVPMDARVWSTGWAGTVVLVVLASTVEADPDRYAALSARGVRVDTYQFRDLRGVAHRLGGTGVQSLLVEGGPALQQAWLETGLVDWLQWIRTPVTLRCDDGGCVPMVESIRTSLEELDATKGIDFGRDRFVEGPATCLPG